MVGDWNMCTKGDAQIKGSVQLTEEEATGESCCSLQLIDGHLQSQPDFLHGEKTLT